MKTYLRFCSWLDQMGLRMLYDCESGEYLVTTLPLTLRSNGGMPNTTLIASVPSRWVRWEFDKAKEVVEAGLMLANL